MREETMKNGRTLLKYILYAVALAVLAEFMMTLDYHSLLGAHGNSNQQLTLSMKDAELVNCEIKDGKVTAEIKWSSSHYDYMLVDGEKFLPVNTEGNSVFEVPVAEFDKPMTVMADTTAMSVPHEIEYTLTFASDTVTASGSGSGMSGSVNIALWIAVAVAVFIPAVTRMRRKEKK